jgi:polysaccharide biosynthesis/export protein
VVAHLVDFNGNIRLHALGLIKAEGLTKDQLAESIIGKLNGLGVLTDPYAVVRFSNFKITVLGEVKTPGVFTVPSEKASILEAIGLAGDITDYGLKDRILLIREDQNMRSYHRINLLDPNVFGSPYFYLRQNDIVVIEPDIRKPTALDLQTLQYITIAATLASTAAILITLFK